jgi:hypothetical protein
MWQDDAAVATVTKSWVTQANFDAKQYGDTSGDTAVNYCFDLNLSDHTDWRLPSRAELVSLSNFGTNSPAIDTLNFQNIAADGNVSYWSATPRLNTTQFAWNVNFNYGGQYSLGARNLAFHVRCVRTLPLP